MAVLLSAREITHRFEARPLFESLSFGIDTGDRIGLLGPNGAGKSTVLRLLAGRFTPDKGEIVRGRGLSVAYVEQIPELNPEKSVMETLLEKSPDPHDWTAHVLAEELLWKMGLEAAGIHADAKLGTLSGGWKKRLAICRELMATPQVLLLDEPTNHLDIEGILWLEEMLREASFATLTVTHDRLFLQRVSNRILELDRRNEGGILNVKGNYLDYLQVKESLLQAQETLEASLKGVLRRETEWIRQGAKARTTKQQARINRHGDLTGEVSELQYRNKKTEVRFEFQESENQPKRLVEAKHLTKILPNNRPLFKDFELLLGPGTRIGILGTNGCGKTTLLRTLLGLEKPNSGNLFHSEHLKIAYFEQNRDSLNPDETLLRSLCPYGDQVIFQGRPIHIRSYLERFLFAHDRMEIPVGRLSGGEQSRVLIARLMLKEANLLVLDEPTNDLDMATLNVLQDCLTQFDGAILLVSHDRYFLDQVSTKILAFPILEEEKAKGTLHFFEGLSQWEEWHRSYREQSNEKSASKSKSEKSEAPKANPVKSANAEQTMKKIERKEADLDKLNRECENPSVSGDFQKLSELGKKISTLQNEIEQLYKQL